MRRRPNSPSSFDDRQPRVTKSGEPPDLVILVVASYRVVVDRLLAAHRAVGLGDVRPRHGFVIRAVAAESPTINRLAALLDTTKQAASKLADAMTRDGFLERFPDPVDRRQIRLRLAPRGEKVRRRAIATSRAIERELQRAVGPRQVKALRRGLETLLVTNGAGEEALAHRARPVW
jgi:DNA-binding MarR family transcriptional regulator